MNFRARYRRSLSGNTYQDTVVSGDFRCGLALQVTCRDMRFDECRMDQINFSGSRFENCQFIKCDLSGANFNACTFRDCTFDECTLDLAGFKGASIWRSRFMGGRAEYASFEEALIRDTWLNLQLHGADLRFSSTKGLDLSGSNLWGSALNVSCRNFKNVVYSEKQIEMFLGLVAKSTGNEELRGKIRNLISAKSARIIDAVVDADDLPESE
jgi:uncharacterized protein YjbI with pentapeptide repeats